MQFAELHIRDNPFNDSSLTEVIAAAQHVPVPPSSNHAANEAAALPTSGANLPNSPDVLDAIGDLSLALFAAAHDNGPAAGDDVALEEGEFDSSDDSSSDNSENEL